MKTWTIALVAVLIGSTGGTALGVDTYWQAGTGDWSIGGNWDNGEPSGSYMAYINNGGTSQITQPGEVCDYMYLGYGSGENGNLEINSGDLSITNGGYIGYAGTGMVSQQDGVVTANRLLLGYEHDAGASGTYEQRGGTLQVSGYLSLGGWEASIGTFMLSDTAQLFAGNVNLGGYRAKGFFLSNWWYE